MNQVIVNAKGDPCPVPVVKATQALRSMTEPGRLVIYVDNEIAVQNLSRMAASHQFTAHAEKQGEDYVVTVEVTRAMSQGTAAPAQQEAADCIPDARGNTAVVLSGDCMGQGDDTLGRMLMKGFVFALTQLEEISSVKITVRGQELAYREKKVFQSRDVLLSPKEDVVATVQALLYFPDEEGGLQAEERMLDLFEGDTQVGAVARALEMGPETKGLSAIFPEGFRVRNLWLEEQTCYVNFSSLLLGYLLEENEQVLESLCRSLCSLESVNEVRFLVDGEFYENYQGIALGVPFVE